MKTVSYRRVQKRISSVNLYMLLCKPQVLLTIMFSFNFYFCPLFFFLWSNTSTLFPISSGLLFLLFFGTMVFFPCFATPLLRFPAHLPPPSQVGVMFVCTACNTLRSDGCAQSCWIEPGSLNPPKREWAIDITNWKSDQRVKKLLKHRFGEGVYLYTFPQRSLLDFS